MTPRLPRYAIAALLTIVAVGSGSLFAPPAAAQAYQQAAPSWEWLAGILILGVGVLLTWGVRVMWAEIKAAHAGIGALRDEVRNEHLTERETREMIGTAIRLALAEQLPVLLQPLRDDVGRINQRLASVGVYRASASLPDDGA